jgi:ribosomal protein S12 methylthiotransferase accessory factor
VTIADLYDLKTPTDVTVARSRLERLVSPRTGIVIGARNLLRFPDESGLPYVAANTASSWVLDDDGRPLLVTAQADGVGVRGGGTYPDLDKAYVSAVGEAAERYSAGYVPVEQLLLAPWEELDEDALPLDQLWFFSDKQYESQGFPFERLDATKPIRWVRGRRLHDGAETLLPAQLVYLNARLPKLGAGEPRLASNTSNGLATGATPTEAATGALLELLERDAFVITWYNRLSFPRLRFDDDRAAAELFERYFRATRLRITTVDLSAFHNIPIVVGITRGPLGTLDPVTVGGAAAGSAFVAWQKAIIESTHVRAWIRNRSVTDLARMRNAAPSEVRTFEDRIAYYSFAQHAAHASFLDASAEVRNLGELPHAPSEPGALLRYLVNGLADRGIDVFYVDVTSPDIAEAGISVARVFAPALCPLPPDERAVSLALPRLRLAPAELGFAAAEQTNPNPHPYP